MSVDFCSVKGSCGHQLRECNLLVYGGQHWTALCLVRAEQRQVVSGVLLSKSRSFKKLRPAILNLAL